MSRYLRLAASGFTHLVFAVALSGALLHGEFALGQTTTSSPPYPRLAAGVTGGWNVYSESRIQNIAKTDAAVLGIWRTWTGGGYDAASLTRHIKSINPNIKLAQYTDVIELTSTDSSMQWVRDKISREKGGNGAGDWWLKTSSGSFTSTYPATYRVNHTSTVTRDASGLRWPEWLARYWNSAPTEAGDWVSAGKGLREGAWDAVFADVQYVTSQGGSGVTADYDNNGVNEDPDSQQVIDWVVGGHVAYRNAWKSLQPNWQHWANMIAQVPPEIAVQPGMNQLNEGGWFEGLMGQSWSPETWGSWAHMMTMYRKGMSLLSGPKIGMFHNNLQYGVQTLGYSEYRWNRYGLTSCLMDNGYYMITVSDAYNEQRWYDEFDVDLGYPIDPPQTAAWSNGVYKREFDKGLVLVNPRRNGGKTVDVGPGWKRFQGQQDPVHNNGQAVSSIYLNEGDGIILVRDGAPPMPPMLQSVQ